MTIFAGIDLAWSGRKPTGVCILEGDSAGVELVRLDCTPADCGADAIVELLATVGSDVVAGIDAPLVVAEGRRAEAELARSLGRFGVYAYSARMDFLERHGITEGPRLGALLANVGWNLDPTRLTAGVAGRHALEVFPHATIVSLLGAPAALKYKKGRIAKRLSELVALQSLLRSFCERGAPGIAVCPLLCEAIQVRGSALKAVEDQLDALACAISAYHLWWHGADGMSVFGDAATGYIAVPKPVAVAGGPGHLEPQPGGSGSSPSETVAR